jgi:DUF4097 and DUF4098 domain-containing protein YvlB
MITKNQIAAAVVVLLIIAVSAAAQDFVVNEKAEFRVGRDGELKIENLSGKIEITGWNGDSIIVEYTKIAKGSMAKTKAGLVQVEMEHHGDEVIIKVDYPDENRRRDAGVRDSSLDVSVNFTIKVPSSTELRVTNISGAVTVGNISSDIKVKVVSGGVNAENLNGDIELESISGSVFLKGGGGEISAHTVSGNVTLEGVNGEVEMTSVSGNLVLSAGSLTGAEMEVTSGNIELSSTMPLTTGEFDLSAFSGNITVSIPAGSAFEIKGSAGGGIKSDFNLEVIQGRHYGMKVEGTVNGGGARIKAKASSGSIRITKR